MDIKKPFVLGAGIMGAGIGQLCAQKGYDVDIVDITDDVLDKAKTKVQKGMERRIEKGKITQEDMDSVLSRMHWSTDIEKSGDSDFVFEAVAPEDFDSRLLGRVYAAMMTQYRQIGDFDIHRLIDNIPGEEMPKFRNLWEHIGKRMPKKGRGKAKAPLDPLRARHKISVAILCVAVLSFCTWTST